MTQGAIWARCISGAFVAALLAAACATSPTGRKQFLAFSDPDMNQMGAGEFEKLKKTTPIEKDPKTTGYVKCVAESILSVTKDPTGVKSWEIVTFRTKDVNAFALPGGKIGVYTGLLAVAQTPEQLAAVLGHEVGHVVARHGNARVSQQLAATGGLVVLQQILAGGEGKLTTTDQAVLVGAMGLTQVGVLMPFGRADESEADVIGLDLMAKAGFNPEQSVQLWRNMSKAGGGQPPEFLSTHPSHETRIENLEDAMPRAKKLYAAAQSQGKVPTCRAPSMVFH